MKPRKRRRPSSATSVLSGEGDYQSVWSGQWEEQPRPQTDVWSPIDTQARTLDWAENDVEEIVRTDDLEAADCGSIMRSNSQYPDLAMIAPSPVGSPRLEFCAPVFAEFTERRNRRALVDHFCNVLSHLIVFKEDTGNPFRQLVLPLSHASSPVLNALFALSSAHLEYRGIENEEKSLDFHNRALQGLAQLIDRNDPARREEVLGAIMLLVYYEVVSCPYSLRMLYI